MKSFFGIWESDGTEYKLVFSGEKDGGVQVQRSRKVNGFSKISSRVHRGLMGVFGWSLPGIELDLGQSRFQSVFHKRFLK